MLKPPKFFILIIVLMVLTIALAFLRGDEDTWLCKDGQWVKHGNPSATMPTQPCK